MCVAAWDCAKCSQNSKTVLAAPVPPHPPPTPCRAERGLSNYLIFQTSKTDPKIAAYAAQADRFEDDAEGQLVQVANAPVQQKARLTLRKATAEGGTGAGVGERKQ
jgi:hypothetical protein